MVDLIKSDYVGKNNLVGKKFGKWTVLEYAGYKRFGKRKSKIHYWLCGCVCGIKKIVQGQSMASGGSKSCCSCKRKDLAGQVFGFWEVLKFAGHANSCIVYECRCGRCGTVRNVKAASLLSGISRSCGCHNGRAPEQHGMTDAALYNRWSKIRRRCFSPSDKAYPHYGARGITVCSGMQSFQNFVKIMGEPPSEEHYSTDRINNDGHYSCGACRQCIDNRWPLNIQWGTPTMQTRNRANTIVLEFRGQSKTVIEWCEELNLTYSAVYQRLKKGWTVHDALTCPLRIMKRQGAH